MFTFASKSVLDLFRKHCSVDVLRNMHVSTITWRLKKSKAFHLQQPGWQIFLKKLYNFVEEVQVLKLVKFSTIFRCPMVQSKRYIIYAVLTNINHISETFEFPLMLVSGIYSLWLFTTKTKVFFQSVSAPFSYERTFWLPWTLSCLIFCLLVIFWLF